MCTCRYNVYMCTHTFIQHNYIHILSQQLHALCKIREYCYEESKDVVCPEPSLPIYQPPDIHHVPFTKSLLKNALHCTFASARSRLSFLNPMSRCTLHRILRRGCKAVGPGNMTHTVEISFREIFGSLKAYPVKGL